jgi:hypothetical protein
LKFYQLHHEIFLSFEFLIVKYVQKSETLALKRLYQLQKIGNFWILVFGLNLTISDTLSCNIFLGLFNRKKSRVGMNSEAQFLRKKKKKKKLLWHSLQKLFYLEMLLERYNFITILRKETNIFKF